MASYADLPRTRVLWKKKKEQENTLNTEQQDLIYSKAYAQWTKEEDQKLIELYSKGETIEELCKIFARNKGAIKSRIKKNKSISAVEEVLLTIEGVSSTSFTILEDDISRLTYVLKPKIQTIQFPTIILKFSRIIVTKESNFIKAYTIRVFLILLYDRNESFIILYIVMQFGHIFTNCP